MRQNYPGRGVEPHVLLSALRRSAKTFLYMTGKRDLLSRFQNKSCSELSFFKCVHLSVGDLALTASEGRRSGLFQDIVLIQSSIQLFLPLLTHDPDNQ